VVWYVAAVFKHSAINLPIVADQLYSCCDSLLCPARAQPSLCPLNVVHLPPPHTHTHTRARALSLSRPMAAGMACIRMSGQQLLVPHEPTIPFIEGDGTGPDIWKVLALPRVACA
jgi:hypothetical protein